jgi:competence protein ComEC
MRLVGNNSILKITTKALRLIQAKLSSRLIIIILLSLILGLTVSELGTVCIIFLLCISAFVKKSHILVLIMTFGFGLIYSSHYSNHIEYQLTQVRSENQYIVELIEDGEPETYSQKIIFKKADDLTFGYAEIEKYPLLKYGDRLEIYGSYSMLENTPTYNKKDILRSRRITYEIKVNSYKVIGKKNDLMTILNSLKMRTINIINKGLNEPESSLVSGILIGKNLNFSEEFKNNLIASGTSHIVSISGYNFSIIFTALLTLGSTINKRLLYIASILFILLFLVFIGLTNLSAQRATIMILLIIISKILGRPVNSWIFLFMALLIIILQYPGYVKNISLILTMLATAGILAFTPFFTKFFKKLRTPKVFSENLITTFSVSIATIPVPLLIFKSFSLTGIISNIIILPLIPMLMLVSFLGVISSLIGIRPAEIVIFGITNMLAKFINKVIELLGVRLAEGVGIEKLNLLIMISLIFLLLIFYIKNKRMNET